MDVSLLNFIFTTMVIHAILQFIVIETNDWGLIDVDGVGVQQVHELVIGIVRTTATLSESTS